jgi:hypothetical protein
VTSSESDEELELAAAPGVESEPLPDSRRGRSSGIAGSMLAGALLGLRDALEGPKKEQIVVQVDAAGDPPDIDVSGLDDPLDDGHHMHAPPLDDLKARGAATRSRGSRRRGRSR